MLYLCTPKRTSPLPLDKDSREILRTGELRIADSVYELSEDVQFVVSVCIGRAKILLTLDRGKVIYPVTGNRVLRARAMLIYFRRFFLRDSLSRTNHRRADSIKADFSL